MHRNALRSACLLAACTVASAGSSHSDSGPDCRLGIVGGVPTFMFAGKPDSGICYSTYDTFPPRLLHRATQFAEAGCHLYNFVVEIAGYGYSRPMWAGPDQWDFAQLDERARTIVEADPQARLLPRIYIDAPKWWCDANPDELMVLANGSRSFGSKLFALSREGDYPSLASEKWRADMCWALDKVIEHIDASEYGDRVVGYQLSGQKTEEWYHWSMNAEPLGDYSPHMTRAFRQWLQARYGTDERLQAAWHRPEASIATAAIPSQAERFGDRSRTFRDPVAEAAVIDFHRFWSDVMADTVDIFAGAVKRKTGGRKLVGAFYAYTFEFTDLGEDAGHLAVSRLERSPNIDFIMCPSSYYNRNLPGKPYFRAPVTSLQLHDKVFWNDFDQVSYKYYDKLKEDPNLKTWEYQMGLTKTPEEFVWMNRREVGMELAQGVQLAHFDIHGGYYDDPVIMEGVRELAQVRKEALLLDERGSEAQVLALVDEDSEHYVAFRSPLHTQLISAQVAELPFVAPYDAALLSDLGALDTSRYRLVLVLNAFKLDAAQRKLIDAKLKCEGRTIIWAYAPGYFDEHGASIANIVRTCGIEVGKRGTEPIFAPEKWAPSLFLRRDFPQWRSIYTARVPLSATVLKGIARRAGVHIYDDDPHHVVFANRHFLTICADERGGRAAIRLRRKATATDTATGEVLCRDADSIVLQLRPKEVRLLRMM